MNVRHFALCSALWLSLAPSPLLAEEAVDLDAASRIRQEALTRSQVMDLARELTDGLGPRVTGSPGTKRANQWTRDKLASWGLKDARLEPWGPFGEGWTLERVVAHQTKPWAAPLHVMPKAWAPGTNGVIKAAVTQAKLESEADFEPLKGKLAGKILLLGEAAKVTPGEKPAFSRYTEKDLEELAHFELASPRNAARRAAAAKRWAIRKKLSAFLESEQVAAVLEPSETAGLVLASGGGSREKGESKGVPTLALQGEQWNRLSRLLEKGVEVEVELSVQVSFQTEDLMAYNTLADLPGTDKKGEIVMLGAHLDSWHGATGATDDAAGVAVTMEALRVLKSLGVAPRRTIRIALWTGEEQGLLGSRAYVAQQFGSRPPAPGPAQDLPPWMRKPGGPVQLLPAHSLLSAYFNLDNGTGRIRGIYAQQNLQAAALFESWMKPYRDLGATTVTLRDTGSTDHVPFDEVGLPGFQFVQDEVEYETRTHHTNLDDYDRLQAEDLKQAAAVVAGFVWQAANRPDRMPRKPLPQDQ